jgi:hypothetical protein
VPALIPLVEELCTAHRPALEFFLSLAPRLLAVAGEEVCKPRPEVAGNVPADGRDRIAGVRSVLAELDVVQLTYRSLGQGLVAEKLSADGFDQCSAHVR